MYTVYKHLNENEEVIYIGKSKSLLYRQRQHKKNAEWFCEVDSIEYCTFSSKSEMDLVEVYLINTLSPKYNKKDKRNDMFVSLKLDELNWLQFDMCEVELDEVQKYKFSKNKIIENFIKENVKCGMYITTIYKEIIEVESYFKLHNMDSNLLLQKVDKISMDNCKLKTEFGYVYDFKNIHLYELTERYEINGFYFNSYKHVYKDFKHRNKDIKNLKIVSYDMDEIVICEYVEENNEWDD